MIVGGRVSSLLGGDCGENNMKSMYIREERAREEADGTKCR